MVDIQLKIYSVGQVATLMIFSKIFLVGVEQLVVDLIPYSKIYLVVEALVVDFKDNVGLISYMKHLSH